MYCTEELDSLCVCPGGSLALEGFAQWDQWHCWSGGDGFNYSVL